MTLPWYDETDLPDWDESAAFEDHYDPDWNPDFVLRPVVTVELPPMPGEET